MPEYEIAVVGSRDLDKAREVARLFGGEPVCGYDAIVARDDVDVAYVPLPTGLHAEWVAKLIQANKHVMVEKTLATTYEESLHLVELARERHVLVMEHFQFLHHRQTAFVRKTLQEGTMGSIRLLRSTFGFPPGPRQFPLRRSPGWRRPAGCGRLHPPGLACPAGSPTPGVCGDHGARDIE